MRQIQVPIITPLGQQFEEPELLPIPIDFQLGKLTVEEIADQYGVVHSMHKELDKWLNGAKEILKARMKEDTSVVGNNFTVSRPSKSRRALSKEKLENKFGVDALEECYSETPYTEIRVSPTK